MAAALLMPVPPPVMTTFFPAAEDSSLVGEMAAYGLLCHVLVNETKLLIGGDTMASIGLSSEISIKVILLDGMAVQNPCVRIVPSFMPLESVLSRSFTDC